MTNGTYNLPVLLVKLNPILLAPWIILTLNPITLFGLELPLTAILVSSGLAGTFLNKHRVVSLTFVLLLFFFVWGKIGSDLYHLHGPDTAVFIFQFISLLFLYELTSRTLMFESDYRMFFGRNDEDSARSMGRIMSWYRRQFLEIGKVTFGALLISLGLVVLGGFASVQVTGLPIAGLLVIGSVLALVLLLTYGREPSTPS